MKNKDFLTFSAIFSCKIDITSKSDKLFETKYSSVYIYDAQKNSIENAKVVQKYAKYLKIQIIHPLL